MNKMHKTAIVFTGAAALGAGKMALGALSAYGAITGGAKAVEGIRERNWSKALGGGIQAGAGIVAPVVGKAVGGAVGGIAASKFGAGIGSRLGTAAGFGADAGAHIAAESVGHSMGNTPKQQGGNAGFGIPQLQGPTNTGSNTAAKPWTYNG